MALNIKKAEAERLANELARATGESLTDAVTNALRERLESVRRVREKRRIYGEVRDLQEFVASLPDRTPGSAEDVLLYDDFGLPH